MWLSDTSEGSTVRQQQQQQHVAGGGTNTPAVADPSLVEALNSFYACFKNSSVNATSIMASTGDLIGEDCPLSLSEQDIRRALR